MFDTVEGGGHAPARYESMCRSGIGGQGVRTGACCPYGSIPGRVETKTGTGTGMGAEVAGGSGGGGAPVAKSMTPVEGGRGTPIACIVGCGTSGMLGIGRAGCGPGVALEAGAFANEAEAIAAGVNIGEGPVVCRGCECACAAGM